MTGTRELIVRLAEYLEEAHTESGELNANPEGVTHFGDGGEGCTYCEAIRDAHRYLYRTAKP